MPGLCLDFSIYPNISNFFLLEKLRYTVHNSLMVSKNQEFGSVLSQRVQKLTNPLDLWFSSEPESRHESTHTLVFWTLLVNVRIERTSLIISKV